MYTPVRLTLLALLMAAGLFVACREDTTWTKYELRRPDVTECRDAPEARRLANLYFIQVSGLEVQHIPATFSMSDTFQTGDLYVIEWIPYEQAGGYPMVSWLDNTKRGRYLHWAVARNAKGEYVTAGDSSRNQLDDVYLGIAKAVGPDRYVGVVKRVFTYPRN